MQLPRPCVQSEITFHQIKRKNESADDHSRDANGIVTALQLSSEAVYRLGKLLDDNRDFRCNTYASTRSLPRRLQIYKTRLRCYLTLALTHSESRFPRLSEVFNRLVRRTSSRRFPRSLSYERRITETIPEKIPRWMISL